MNHACPACGTTTIRPGRCTRCARPENQRKARRENYTSVYATKRWRDLSARILQRDAHTCQVCGKPAQTAGHKEPFEGATDPRAWDERGIRAECRRCNGREAGKRRHLVTA